MPKNPNRIAHDNGTDYTGKDIQVLKGLDGVRKRPAMYIGSTDAYGLHHLVYEVVDNSVDEAMAGFCTAISVILHNDGSVTVDDNGRGIPVDYMPDEKKPAVEVVLTTLHAGGKFDRKTYKASGGLHGVGVSCVNALSEWLTAEIRRDGKTHRMRFARGAAQGKMKVVGASRKTGTKISFLPDPQIFSNAELSFETLSERLRETSFLNAGVRIFILDERTGKSHDFQYRGGIVEFVKHLNETKEPVHPKVIHVFSEKDDMRVEAALQYNSSYQESVHSFVNSINTRDGGTHLAGFRQALTRAVNQHANQGGLLKKTRENLRGEDLSEGLTAVVSIRIPEPQFEGQTKNKLGNSDVKGIVDSLVYEKLLCFFDEHPAVAKKILDKAVDAALARDAARKAKDLVRKQGAVETDGLSGKLADCQEKDTSVNEIFLVEGDSAGGSAKQARNRKNQAILPLKGKILNVEKARVDKMLGNQEIRNLVSALGVGIGKDGYNPDSLRYGKIIIMTDADVDGAHIRTLLLTFFFRNMKDLFDRGNIYIAQPPLYGVKNGRDMIYFHDDTAFTEHLMTSGMADERINGKNAFLSGAKAVAWLRLVSRLASLARRCETKGIPPFMLLHIAGKTDSAIASLTRESLAKKFFYEMAKEWRENPSGVENIGFDLFHADNPANGEVACSLTWKLRKIQRRFVVDNAFLDSPDVREAERLLGDVHKGLAPPYSTDLRGITCKTENPMVILQKVLENGRTGRVIQRYKGLGEMNPEQLWETAMNPDTRTLVRMRVADEIDADQMFTTLMGESADLRREYMSANTYEPRDLDV